MTKVNSTAGAPGYDSILSVMQQARDLQAKKPPVPGRPVAPGNNSTTANDNSRYSTDGVERGPKKAIPVDQDVGAHEPASTGGGRRLRADVGRAHVHLADTSATPPDLAHLTPQDEAMFKQFWTLASQEANAAGAKGDALLNVVGLLINRPTPDATLDRVKNALKNIAAHAGPSDKHIPAETLRTAIKDLWTSGATRDLKQLYMDDMPASASTAWAQQMNTALNKAGLPAFGPGSEIPSDIAPTTSSTQPSKPAAPATPAPAPLSSTLSSLLKLIESLRSIVESMAAQNDKSEPPFTKKPTANTDVRPQPATSIIVDALAPILKAIRQMQAGQAASTTAAPAAHGKLAAFAKANERSSAPNAHAAGASANAAFNAQPETVQGAMASSTSFESFLEKFDKMPAASKGAFTQIADQMRKMVAEQKAFTALTEAVKGATGATQPAQPAQPQTPMSRLLHALVEIRSTLASLLADLKAKSSATPAVPASPAAAPAPSQPAPQATAAAPEVKTHHRHTRHDVKWPHHARPDNRGDLEKAIAQLDALGDFLQKLLSALTSPAVATATPTAPAQHPAPVPARAMPPKPGSEAGIALKLMDQIEALLKKLLSDPAVTGTGTASAGPAPAVPPQGTAGTSTAVTNNDSFLPIIQQLQQVLAQQATNGHRHKHNPAMSQQLQAATALIMQMLGSLVDQLSASKEPAATKQKGANGGDGDAITAAVQDQLRSVLSSMTALLQGPANGNAAGGPANTGFNGSRSSTTIPSSGTDIAGAFTPILDQMRQLQAEQAANAHQHGHKHGHKHEQAGGMNEQMLMPLIQFVGNFLNKIMALKLQLSPTSQTAPANSNDLDAVMAAKHQLGKLLSALVQQLQGSVSGAGSVSPNSANNGSPTSTTTASTPAPSTDAYDAILQSMQQAQEQMDNVQAEQVRTVRHEVHKHAHQAHAMDSSRR